ncbi:MAG: hypothetical protein HY918_01035 [Candidatus Doudnabacteria bacterium]|nr:hypothetical protein [Candidatus Doudnabacteria bacterium]
MFNENFNKKIKLFFLSDLGIFIMLSLVVFIANFLYFKNFGIYGDDWDAGIYLRFNGLREGVHYWWSVWAGEINNFRPIAVILPIVWFYFFKFFGLPGVHFSIFLIHATAAFLIYKYFSGYAEKYIAFLGALFFALYPTNNAYLWQVATTYVLSLCFVLLSVLSYQKKYKFLAAFLFLFSVLVNEATAMLFVLALIPKHTVSRAEFIKQFKEFAYFFIPILALYIAVRVGFEHTGLIVGGRTKGLLNNFKFSVYLFQFIQAFAVVFFTSWGLAGWKIIQNFKDLNWLTWLVGIAIFAFIRASFETELFKDKNQESLRANYLYFLIGGFVLIFAGRYYGFYFQPSINTLNLDSRYYYAASLAGPVFLVGLLIYAKANFSKFWPNIVTLVAIILGILGIFKISVQRDYANAWLASKEFWRQEIKAFPALRENELVVVYVPKRKLGQLVGVGEAIGDLRKLFPFVYGPTVNGVTTFLTQSIDQTPESFCINSHPFWINRCFQKNNVEVLTFEDNKLVLRKKANPSPDSRSFEQNLPEALKNIILK